MSNDGKNRTLLEHLPVEIFLQIFTFFPLQELIKAFFGLNSHIDSIIRLLRSASHTINCNNNDAINLLHLFSAQISRLVIVDAETVDFTSFINLRSLTLKYGTHAQFNSIRPQYFPMLEILHVCDVNLEFDTTPNINTETINNLFQVILSNGFPRLQMCTAVRIGALVLNERWVGSPALRSLHLDVETVDDYEKLRSIYPHLKRFTSFGPYWIHPPRGIVNGIRKRLFDDIRKLKQLEFEGKFILDISPIRFLHSAEPPPRFNNTEIPQRSHEKDVTVIQGRILPKSYPYCHASFLIEITVPRNYPFTPPGIISLDPIYHSSVDERGCFFCCYKDLLGREWHPSMTLTALVEASLRIIDNTPTYFLSRHHKRAEEYRNNRETFYTKALQSTFSYGRPRY